MPLFLITHGSDKDYTVAKDYQAAVDRWKDAKRIEWRPPAGTAREEIPDPASVSLLAAKPLLGEFGDNECEQLEDYNQPAPPLDPATAFNFSGTMTGRASCDKPNVSSLGSSSDEPASGELWQPQDDEATMPEVGCVVKPSQWSRIVGHIVVDRDNNRWIVRSAEARVVSIDYWSGSNPELYATGSTFNPAFVHCLCYRGPRGELATGAKIPPYLWRHLAGHVVVSKVDDQSEFEVLGVTGPRVKFKVLPHWGGKPSTFDINAEMATKRYVYGCGPTEPLSSPRSDDEFPTTYPGWADKLNCTLEETVPHPSLYQRFRIHGMTIDGLILVPVQGEQEPREVSLSDIPKHYKFVD